MNTTASRRLYTMNTNKTDKGFCFVVREFTETAEPQQNGQYGTWATMKRIDGFKTRARATAAGKKWKMHYKAK